MKNRDKGILLFLLSLIIGICNDGISKYLSNKISYWEISFFRLLFSSLTILPFAIYKGSDSLKTKRLSLHILRGFILFLALVLWNFALSKSHLPKSTIIGFASPIFIVILAFLFLNEKITWKIVTATILGFLGIIISLNPFKYNFDYYSLFFLISAFLFSILDIINKKYIIKESYLTMIIYSSTSALIFVLPQTIYYWYTPNITDLILLIFIGIGGNLLLYLILKSFTLTKISVLAPFKYTELPISLIISHFTFNYIPDIFTFVGALIIIPCALYIVYNQRE